MKLFSILPSLLLLLLLVGFSYPSEITNNEVKIAIEKAVNNKIYSDGSKRALSENKLLIIWINLENRNTELRTPNLVHIHISFLNDDLTPRVIVGRPDNNRIINIKVISGHIPQDYELSDEPRIKKIKDDIIVYNYPIPQPYQEPYRPYQFPSPSPRYYSPPPPINISPPSGGC